MKGNVLLTASTALLCLMWFLALDALPATSGASKGVQQEQEKARAINERSVKSKTDLKARTPDEHARAKFFDRYGGDTVRPGDYGGVGSGTPVPPYPPDFVLPTYERFVQRIACAHQLIVLGKAQETGVLLNEKETYLFTDYNVRVDRWLRPERGAPTLRVSVAGGRVSIGGQPTRIGFNDPLDPIRPYIFFLEQIPGSWSLTPIGLPMTDGLPWHSFFRDTQLIPELANANVRLDMLTDDIQRLGAACKSGKGQ